ncbi:MAG: cation acetate symporter [Actinomycetota bacterium]|nr:cation acetate symporter [Actinomycetota bacterium]
MTATYAVVAVALVALTTLAIGAFGLRLSRTTSDFYVASRTVSPVLNASAIGGEYLSAASFLGVAGLVLAYGVDMLWFPIGYTAGYLVLLVLVAAPLRRSGAYTLPDFAEARLESKTVRRVASALVVLIGWLYLVPQLQGAGLTLRAVAGLPLWAGPVVVAVVVVLNVVAGGMRSITFVQAFQYWLKLTAIAVPLVFLVLAWRADGAPVVGRDASPTFRADTTVRVETDTAVRLDRPVRVHVDGAVDGRVHDGAVRLDAGAHEVGRGAVLRFPAGSAVPHAEPLAGTTGEAWATPVGGARDRAHPLYSTYSLMLALFLGTMGLPHVLVRFYTNPDGPTARRTTLAVLVLLAVFYLAPTAYGVLGRLYTPELLLTGRTDAVVLLLPERMVGGTAGAVLTAVVTAGAFAAFLSTSSGLAVSVAGVLSQDVLRGSVRGFRAGAVLAVAVPLGLALVLTSLPLADVVGLAFAVAASSFCPLLLLGIWWRRLTDVGAVSGLVVGGTLATVALVSNVVGGNPDGWPGALLAQPAAWTVPVSFAVMVAVSLATRSRVPAGAGRTLVRLHAPEDLALSDQAVHP